MINSKANLGHAMFILPMTWVCVGESFFTPIIEAATAKQYFTIVITRSLILTCFRQQQG